MKQFKLIFICVIFIILIMCFSTGCINKSLNETFTANDNNTLKICTGYDFSVFVDPDTGINYLVNTWDGAFNERYNADGTLYVSEVDVW